MLTSRTALAAIMLVLGLVPASTAFAQFGNPGLTTNFGSASFGGITYGLNPSPGWTTGTFGSRNLGASLNPRPRTFALGYSAFQANSGRLYGNPGFNQTNPLQPGAGLPYGTNGGTPYTAGMVNSGLGQVNSVNPGVNPNDLPYSSYYNPIQQNDNRGATNATMVTVRKAVIEYPPPQGAVLSAAVTGYLERSLRERITEPLSASYQGRTLILTGAVATDHDRTLAERMALLEPGVEAVQNELLVHPKAGADLPPPK